jgi:hypothetical protein
MSKDGYDMILTVPSPVVAKRCKSGELGVGMWWEKVVALVCTGCGCDSSAVYVVDPSFEFGDDAGGRLVTPSVRIYDEEGDSIEMGIKVSSWDPEKVSPLSIRRFSWLMLQVRVYESEVPSVTRGCFNTPFFPP